jgi:seryl-tRNA synthetase
VLDIKMVIAETERVKRNCETRGYQVDLDGVLELEQKRKQAIAQVDALRNQQKTLAKQFHTGGGAEDHREQAKKLKEEESGLSEQLTQIESELREKLSWFPNLLDPRVPVGGEEQNQIVRTVGTQPSFDFEPRSHEELGEALNLIDIPRGVKVAKARFYCLKNEAVRMRYALIQMFLDHVAPEGFQLVCPPFLAKSRTLFASGYLPFSQKDNFKLESEDLSLIGTSEQALLGMHIDEMLDKLPILYCGDSMCFRTEAGSYGRDTAGILRVHQFYKLEQIVYCRPEESEKWHQRCLENAEWLMQELGVPYRVVLTASGDMGAPGAIKLDTEAWMPSQKAWRETTSDTNLTDYQTRRGNIRFKIGGEKGVPHTISATGFTDRLILAILENFQQKDGSVVLPEKLVRYMNGQTHIRKK